MRVGKPNTRVEEEFMPTTSTKNVIQEFHLYIFSLFVCNYFMHPNKLKLILSLVQGEGVVLGVGGGGGWATHFMKQTPIVIEV
jgi:hypothetical protein